MRSLISPGPGLKQKRIAVICGDAGGTNAILPVIGLLSKDPRFQLDIFSYREGRRILKNRGYIHSELDENLDVTGATGILRACNADFVLSDTSLNSLAVTSAELEKYFFLAARQLKIPSLSVLDYWSNYTIRFSDNRRNLIYLPDRIAIMDRQAFDEMVSEGFPADSLVITGQPAYDELQERKPRFSDERKKQILEDLGIAPGDLAVVFASEPVLSGNPLHTQHPGYTEETVLQLLIASLDAIHAGTGLRIVLIIRPHPKEDPEKFKNIKGRNTRIVLSTEGDSRDVVMAADLVTGISSTILIEACILGCIVASLQPGLMIRDILPTNRAGYTMLISRRDEMTPVLRDLLLNPVSRESIRKTLSTLQYDGNAARRVVELMCTMLHRKDSAFR
jgi:hypothetical protein